jgi:hypothetical protein
VSFAFGDYLTDQTVDIFFEEADAAFAKMNDLEAVGLDVFFLEGADTGTQSRCGFRLA